MTARPLSSAPNPTHAYATAGTKTATLTVTDDNGLSATDTVDRRGDRRTPHRPRSSRPTSTSGQGPLLVNFDGTDSSDDGSIVCYLWDFGGGQTSTDAEASFTFTTVGTHPVTLTVTDNEGATGHRRR